MHFEIPVTAQAQSYKVLGQVGQQVAHIPAYGTKTSLNRLAMLHADGATGGLKMMGGNAAGLALAIGPQAYFDYTSSTTLREFANKSAYSQPTNVASFAAGVTAGALVSVLLGASAIGAAPLVLILFVGWGAGLATQAAMVGMGYDKDIGNLLTK